MTLISLLDQHDFINDLFKKKEIYNYNINDTLMPLIYNILKNGNADTDKHMSLMKDDLGMIMFCIGLQKHLIDDKKDALDFFTKSADLSNCYAMRYIGDYYYDGYIVSKDRKTALEWYKKSGILGDTTSMYYVGHIYINGDENMDFNIAYNWYKKSADLNNSQGIYSLAVRYYNGEGVERDYKTAFELFEKSANLGNSQAMYDIGEYYYYGTGGIKEDKKIAFKLFENAFNLGNMKSAYYIGECYYHEHGVEKNISNAIKWYKIAADNNIKSGIKKLKEISVYDAIDYFINIKMENEHLTNLNEHLKLYPGTDYEKAKADFLYLSSL